MSLNLLETPKTSIYDPKHTKNTKTNFETLIQIIYLFFPNLPSFLIFKGKNNQKSKSSEFYADLYGILYTVEGHTA